MTHATRRTAGLLLLLYFILAGVWTWRLAPRQTDDREAQQRQTMQERIVPYLAKAPDGTAMPALMGLVGLPQDQLQALADWVSMPPVGQVRHLTVYRGPISTLGPEWGDFLLHAWLAHAQPVDLLEVHLMIAASGDRLSDDARHSALGLLARRALAQGDAPGAVTILGRATELPGATWETLQQLTNACRAARNTAPAMRALHVWIQRHQDSGTHPDLEEARDLELALMLADGLTPEALSQQLSDLAGGSPYSERLLDRAYLVARRAHQGSRLLPILERHLQSFPEHDLPSAKLAFETDIHPDYVRWLTCQAAICDEEQPATIAFAAYLRLAAARSPLALPRLCALATTPALKAEAATALSVALDRPEMQLTVLQLAQTESIAHKVLAERLRAAPRQRDLHFSATLAAAAAQTHGSTAVLWQDYMRRFPEDLAAQRRLIQAHLKEQQPALALRAYAEIPAQALTAEDRAQQEILKQL
ncbi:hypothetical protein EI77_04195 [Prosthecobacter fusiformis]|uniref:Uncharacterized protein n=1 Tax=Prosthecobacter fusiformis TaxID=48464 RepID=A0A4R7RJH5_9BACT|nr:hypothetical protein [Prosthecobacter fusiformis]TDU64307.1 hypothetical protein EI77_04195 [Prosthecobacter fusiformis]